MILSGQDQKLKAIEWIKRSPWNTRVTFQSPVRSLDQNSKFWAALSDIAQQVTWHGQKLSTDDWKTIFIASLKTELRIVPNLDNNGFVSLGHSSSNLSKEEFSDLLTLVIAFGDREGVQFHEPRTTED